MSRLRWNPLLGEWVITTPSRADRPFQARERECPFCPGQRETAGSWKVLTLDNKFSALDPAVGPLPLDGSIVMDAPAYGVCKVIILSRNHDEQIENMDDNQLLLVFREYMKVFGNLDEMNGISYIMQFENRGKSIGVSLNHPHAQVYALPFIPPRIRREIEQCKKKWDDEHSCLVCEIVQNELNQGTRVVKETETFVSCVPFFARLPYEVHIYPKEHVGSLNELDDNLLGLGKMVQDTVKRYSNVFDETAYVMSFHTRPSGGKYPFWHFHIEFYPPWRDKNRRKYLAGIELGAGTYTNDSLPEQRAEELREAL
ncbi:MAG: galactose-1-phosphate uridylyltransferase [Candidatus Thorarchaeota archaeon]